MGPLSTCKEIRRFVYTTRVWSVQETRLLPQIGASPDNEPEWLQFDCIARFGADEKEKKIAQRCIIKHLTAEATWKRNVVLRNNMFE